MIDADDLDGILLVGDVTHSFLSLQYLQVIARNRTPLSLDSVLNTQHKRSQPHHHHPFEPGHHTPRETSPHPSLGTATRASQPRGRDLVQHSLPIFFLGEVPHDMPLWEMGYSLNMSPCSPRTLPESNDSPAVTLSRSVLVLVLILPVLPDLTDLTCTRYRPGGERTSWDEVGAPSPPSYPSQDLLYLGAIRMLWQPQVVRRRRQITTRETTGAAAVAVAGDLMLTCCTPSPRNASIGLAQI